jgi:hypothetical protein
MHMPMVHPSALEHTGQCFSLGRHLRWECPWVLVPLQSCNLFALRVTAIIVCMKTSGTGHPCAHILADPRWSVGSLRRFQSSQRNTSRSTRKTAGRFGFARLPTGLCIKVISRTSKASCSMSMIRLWSQPCEVFWGEVLTFMGGLECSLGIAGAHADRAKSVKCTSCAMPADSDQ